MKLDRSFSCCQGEDEVAEHSKVKNNRKEFPSDRAW